MKKRVGILISGRGSNMMALVEAARAADYPAEIATVISSRPDAPDWPGRDAKASPLAIDHKAYASREAFDEAIHAALTEAGVELVALAGFMRIQSPGFVAQVARPPAQHPPLAAAPVQGAAPAQAGAAGGCEDLRLHACTSSPRRWTQGRSSPRPPCRCIDGDTAQDPGGPHPGRRAQALSARAGPGGFGPGPPGGRPRAARGRG